VCVVTEKAGEISFFFSPFDLRINCEGDVFIISKISNVYLLINIT